MITEDYVSFEVAKLLKEKGFDEPCYSSYKKGVFSLDSYMMTNVEFNNNAVSAPTLQIAMKWLREVHKLYIELVLNQDIEYEDAVIENYYFFNVSRIDRFTNEGGDYKSYKSYEEACEAAIKYCLTNLIK